MIISSARFVISNSDPSKCPDDKRPEFAFIGRSNVGKSSLINMLTRHKGLAKTSSTPGKTQLINHFLINDSWFLVDLPGYGYAKVDKKSREVWSKMIFKYLRERKNLVSVFVLIDSRIPLQKLDAEFMASLGIDSIPFSIVYTKIDKLTKNELSKNIAAIRKELKKEWENLPPEFYTSAESALGRDELLTYINECSDNYFES
jgi:GTP-binding protein